MVDILSSVNPSDILSTMLSQSAGHFFLILSYLYYYIIYYITFIIILYIILSYITTYYLTYITTVNHHNLTLINLTNRNLTSY